MRGWLTGMLVLLVLSGGCISQVKPEAGVCKSMADLSKDDITKFDTISSNYLNYLKDGNYAELEKHLSLPLKKALEGQDTEKSFDAIKGYVGNIKEKKLIEVFNIVSTPNTYSICSQNLNKPDTTFSVYYPDVSKYVLTVYEVTTEAGNKVYYINGLAEEGGEWKIWVMHIQIASVAGKSATDFLSLADMELNKGNNRTAIFYRIMAITTSLNTQYVKSQTVSGLEDEVKSMVEKADSQGFYEEWTTDLGKTFKVYSIVLKQAKTEAAINVKYITADLKNQKAVDEESKEMAKYVKSKFPGYEEVFAGVIVTAAEKVPKPGEAVDAYNNVYRFDEL